MQPFALPVGFFIEILMLPLFQWGLEIGSHALGKTGVLTTHSAGKAHTEAMVSWQEYQIRTRTGQSIGVQLDNIGSQVICQNRKYVVALIEGILYCSQQGIALRGHNESDDSLNPGNFKSLMVRCFFLVTLKRSAVISRITVEVPHGFLPLFRMKIFSFLLIKFVISRITVEVPHGFLPLFRMKIFSFLLIKFEPLLKKKFKKLNALTC